MERNDTGRKGSNREEITRKIKKILRESSIKRIHTGLDGKSGRVEQTETAEAFEERVRNDGYQYAVFGGTAVAFKTSPESKWNENARVAAEHLENLGVTVIVLDGDLLANRKGVTQTSFEGATFGTGDFTTVFISPNLSVDGMETAYHEAFHALKRMNGGAKYHHKMIDTIAEGVDIESDAFEAFISYILRGDVMSNSIMRDKSKDFAKNIVFLCRNMKSEHKETVLINQLLRSGTSIGANIHEAQYA